MDVRILAITALLAVDESYALDALKQIANSDCGLATVTAAMTIQEWHAGNIGNIKDYWLSAVTCSYRVF